MNQIAVLEYTFIFDPTDTWQHGNQFEKDLADFFSAYGMQADIMDAKGNSIRRILYIQKIEIMPTLVNNPNQAQKTPKQQFNNINKQIKKGLLGK